MEGYNFYLANDILFGLGRFLNLFFLFNRRYGWLLLLDFPRVRLLNNFNFFLGLIPPNSFRLNFLSFMAFINRCPFPHVYFLGTSLFRPKYFLSTGPHSGLGDLPRDFIFIPRWDISRWHILDCSFIAIASGNGRFLLHHCYLRQLALKFRLGLSLLDLNHPLSGLDVIHDGIDLILYWEWRGHLLFCLVF